MQTTFTTNFCNEPIAGDGLLRRFRRVGPREWSGAEDPVLFEVLLSTRDKAKVVRAFEALKVEHPALPSGAPMSFELGADQNESSYLLLEALVSPAAFETISATLENFGIKCVGV